jgi:isopenicillin N synthase-like dioxygenase
MKTGRPRQRFTREEKIHHLTWRIFQTGRQYQQIAGYPNQQPDFGAERAAKLQQFYDEFKLLTRRILKLAAEK